MANLLAWQSVLDDEDQEQKLQHKKFNLFRRNLRNTQGPFSIPDKRFTELYRLSKELVVSLVNELRPHMRASQRITGFTPEQKVIAALRFYASGSYQRGDGQHYTLPICQSSVSRIISEVSSVITKEIAKDWIKFPVSMQEKRSVKKKFFEATGFPGVIGAIDGTHVNIVAPRLEEHVYINRHGVHSKNVQIICDFDLRILSVNARYPGGNHDSAIWRMSGILDELQRCHDAGDHTSYLLGDSGYPLQPWLMTPITPEPLSGSAEAHYNKIHTRTRNCIERLNGVLKSRFRCILGERVLKYEPSKVGDIVVACCTLHNMCVQSRVPYTDGISEDPISFDEGSHGEMNQDCNQDDHVLRMGKLTQQRIIHNYFS